MPAGGRRCGRLACRLARHGWIGPTTNDETTAPTDDAWRLHWSKCIEVARTSDILLFINNRDERACGGLIELGAALAGGAQVFVVSPDWWSVSHHPRCRVFDSLEAAIAAIVAMQAGERAREAVDGRLTIMGLKKRAPPTATMRGGA
jgi:hypothetical protein